MELNKILVNNAWEIFELAKAQHMDIGVARDMFCTNLENFGVEGAEFYEGADVDYVALSAEWKAMSADEKAAAKKLYTQATQALYNDLTSCRRKGDEATFMSLVTSYVPPVEEDEDETKEGTAE